MSQLNLRRLFAKTKPHNNNHPNKLHVRSFTVLCLLFLTAAFNLNAHAQLFDNQFFQGFETNNSGWVDNGSNLAPVRTITGTNGIPAKTGNYYGQISADSPSRSGNTFTRWGGYNSAFPSRGYTTSVAIYLDVAGNFANNTPNNTRFDFTSAINDTAGNHRRDFAFNAGYYYDVVAPGSGPRFVVSASNGVDFGYSEAPKLGTNPVVITASGWYRFEQRFAQGVGGTLAVVLTIIDPSGNIVPGTGNVTGWVFSDPSDIIGTTVGGNRYGWFAVNDFPTLAIDDSSRDNRIKATRVDDDGAASATDCDAAGPAFTTIQAGIDDSTTLPGDLVSVCPGTYVEDVNINKAGLKVVGESAANTTISGPFSGLLNTGSATVRIGANNVTVASFRITREGNNPTDWNNAGLNSAGVAIQGQAITNALIRDNNFYGNRTAIDVNDSSGHTIRNNVIDTNRTGLVFRNRTDNITMVENYITNNFTLGVIFLDGSNSLTPPQQALNSKFNNNSINNNWYGQVVDRQSGGSLPAPGTTNVKNFRFNWLGTTSPVVTTANSAEPGYGSSSIPVVFGGTATNPGGQPDIAGPASANIQYTPLLTSGTDTNIETTPGRGTFGFQGASASSLITVKPGMLNGWFFYNDETDVIDNSLGSFVPGPATPPFGVGSAQSSVTGTQRRNLATYQFSGTPLADITTWKFSTYNPSAGNGGSANRSGYLNFNVDFNGSDTFQRRLVFLPSDNGTVAQNTWQEWDTINGGNALWRYSGSTWPVGVGGGGEPGTSTKTWTQILSQYPGIRIRVTDAFVGIRVGEPYPDGYTENIDGFKFGTTNSVTFDFEPARPSVTINQAVGQADPTSTSPINFTVTFSEPVTGFDASDVVIGGTAGASTKVVTGSGPTYNVAVGGMTVSGTVTATVVDSAATANSNGAPNTASTSTDNMVTYLICNNVSVGTTLGPDGTKVLRNTNFTVPINVDNTTGQGILGYQFTLTYDKNVLTLNSVTNAGTLSSGFSIIPNNTVPGILTVSAFVLGTNPPLSGMGPLLNLNFTSTGAIGTTSALTFTNFQFNEGVPCVNTTSGKVTVISGTISGNVYYADNTSKGVRSTNINAAGSIARMATTDVNGDYTLSGFGPGSYTVTPSKTGDVNGAVTGADASEVAKYVAGLPSLVVSDVQKIAADVTGDGTISSLDAAYISQYDAGIANPGREGTWVFVPANRVYPNVETSSINQNYQAILYGDVTQNWTSGITRATPTATKQESELNRTVVEAQGGQIIAVMAPVQTVGANSDFAATLTTSDTTGQGIFSYSFNLVYTPSVILPKANLCDGIGTISSSYSLTCNPNFAPNTIRVVAFGTSALSGGGPLLKLNFATTGATSGSTSPLTIQNFRFNEGVPTNVTTNGQITIASPTAAQASLSGRVTDSIGTPIPNASLTLTNSVGETITRLANVKGKFLFNGLTPGEIYIVTVSAKHYSFRPQVVSLTSDLTELNFIAEP